MAKALILRTVSLGKAPGFDRGSFPALGGLKPGLNVVWGANGAGKSTLSRALRSLLWPDPDGVHEAAAEAEADGEVWRLERDGRWLRHTRLADNKVSEGQWGDRDDADRHQFPLHLLLQERREDGHFKDFIRNEMRGGLDLDAARAAAGGTDKPLNPKVKANADFEEADRRYREIKQAQDAQKDLRDRIQTSQARVEEAREGARRLQAVRKAGSLRKAVDELDEARIRLAEFPAGVEKVMADDPRRVEDLEGRLKTLRQELAEGIETRRVKELALAKLAVPEALVRDGALRVELQEALEALPALRLEKDAKKHVLNEAKERERTWRKEFRWLVPELPEEASLQGMVGQLKGLASTCEPLRCALDAADRRAKGLGAREETAAADTAEFWGEVQACLKDWQGESLRASAPVLGRRITNAHLALAVLGTAVTAALGAWGALHFPPLLPVLALLAPLAAGAALAFARGKADPEADAAAAAADRRRGQIQSMLQEHPELLPRQWTAPAILALQACAAERLGRANLRQARNEERARAQEALRDARLCYEQWLKDWDQAAALLGLRAESPGLEGAQFFHFGGHLTEWIRIRETIAIAQRNCEEAENTLDAAVARLRALVAAQGVDHPAAGAEGLTAQAKDLQDRRDKAAVLWQQLEDLREALHRKGDLDLKTAEEDLRLFWIDRGFAVPDRDALAALAERKADHQDATSLVRSLEAQVQAARETADPEVASLAGDRSWIELEEEARTLETLAGTLETCVAEATGLQVRYKGLLEGDELARALQHRLRCEAARDQALQENTLGRVVDLLVKELKDRTLLEDQPPVLRRAGAWLQRFTGNRYQLGMNPDTGFFVRDMNQARIFTLDELSSGTRVQLLFAVRLAFIEQQEGQAVNLPIFLDEVLANSDDDRARAMIEAVLEIAKDRQVFYFTAQADEVAKWKLAAGEGGLNEIPLDRLQGEDALLRFPRITVPAHAFPLPEPTLDYEAYGEACQAPGAALFEPLEAHHAWHLYTRSEDLHAVLRRRFRLIGQLLGDPALAGEALRRRLDLLRHAQGLARRGRGKPFHEKELNAPDFPVTNREAAYWAPMVEMARAAQGDGAAFWATLEPAKIRLQASFKEAILEWMTERGFLSPEPRLDAEAILVRLHQDVDGLTLDSEDALVAERYVRAVVD